MKRLAFYSPAALFLALLGAVGWYARPDGMPPMASAEDIARLDALYAPGLAAPVAPLRVFHLGHSLVGRDMPAMLAQLAGQGHAYESQLGWGTSLREHWEPELQINGFDNENAHPRFRAAHEAIDSGEYDAVVLTEMVEIKDAIRYHRSADYLQRWADGAWAANTATRVYLYETWHSTDEPEGWLERIDRDLSQYWEGRILYPALGGTEERAIYVIPAGQVMARFARELARRGGIGSVLTTDELFSDEIHLSDLGIYLVALTHYAVLYHRSPVGLPYRLKRADGTDALAPDQEAARAMQEIVWEVVTSYPKTGVSGDGV